MIDMVAEGNRHAQQAWRHLEAGDPTVARQWANLGMQSARARRNDCATNPCVLLLALALLAAGDETNGKRWLRSAAYGFERHFDYLGAGVAWTCMALVSGRSFALLERADDCLERALRPLAQAGDVARWRAVKALRERVANDAESLLPNSILQLDSI